MTNKAALLKKYGSPEAVSEHYREMQRKSMENPNRQKGAHKGGFSYGTPEERSERARNAARKRWANK